MYKYFNEDQFIQDINSTIDNIEINDEFETSLKDNNGKKTSVHTLNGSSLAIPRVVAGLLENFQTDNGIKIPNALVNYTGFEIID